MPTAKYRFRLRFFVHAAGVIKHNQRIFEFNLPNGTQATLSSLNSEEISKGTEFVLSAGGFPDEKEALNIGNYLKTALLICGAKLKIGIDAGKDKSSSQLGDHVKDTIFEAQGVKIIDNVHGVSAYSEEYPVQTFSISGLGLVNPHSVEDFVYVLISQYAKPTLSEKEVLALELYGASHFEKSARARFLTLVLAVEALLQPKARDQQSKILVDSFIQQTKISSLSEAEKQSFVGSLNSVNHRLRREMGRDRRN